MWLGWARSCGHAGETGTRARGVWAAMSGHSKWATTKHKKAVVDARRGKLFAKLIKNIEGAARGGGGGPPGEPTVYYAIPKGKKRPGSHDNIEIGRTARRGRGGNTG